MVPPVVLDGRDLGARVDAGDQAACYLYLGCALYYIIPRSADQAIEIRILRMVRIKHEEVAHADMRQLLDGVGSPTAETDGRDARFSEHTVAAGPKEALSEEAGVYVSLH